MSGMPHVFSVFSLSLLTRLSGTSEAVSKAEALRSRLLAWPPDHTERENPTLEQVMSDELGFVD